MDQLKRFNTQIKQRFILFAALLQIISVGVCFALWQFLKLDIIFIVAAYIVVSVILSYIFASMFAKAALEPVKVLGDTVLHLSPGANAENKPLPENLRIGREYITAISYQLYQIASLQDNKDLAEHRREATQASNILAHLPLPVFVFNKHQVVTFGSDSALAYCNLESSELFGKQLFDAVNLEFPTTFTLESWIKDSQSHKVTDTAYWRRVRMTLKDDTQTHRLLDIAGYYNRDNPSGIEFIITLFDRTEEYIQDEDSMSYIALAVHELRNPLTVMRGYIEVFQDELADQLDEEHTRFMRRMQASAQQLTTFVSNILNVARVNENQLPIKIAEQKWKDVVQHAVNDMETRAQTLGKNIAYTIPDNLPTVAVDRLTMYEVLCNLLDNAIKYGGLSEEITITSAVNSAGLVETLIQDKGVGITGSVIPTLFEKYQRNHRNSSQISGTGLGLYLSKAIVSAHGGEIWVQSKEGEGTTVGFTIKPYASLAEEEKNGNNEGMVRTAHGWIKNHSLYRR